MRKQAGPFFYDYVKLNLPEQKSKSMLVLALQNSIIIK